MTPPDKEPIFRIDLPSRPWLPKPVARAASGAIGRALRLNRLEDIHTAVHGIEDISDFLRGILDVVGVRCRALQEDLERVPKEGPCVVIANHPFGAIEGIILAYMLLQVRPDVKVMANYLLGRIPEMRDLFIFVDPFETKEAVATNLKPLRESIRWVKEGHLLACFPAGEVAHYTISNRVITDPEWNPSFARIAQKAGAAVVPMFFSGANSPFFQVMGTIHPRLRTALLPREVGNKRGKTIHLTVGGPIAARQLARFTEPEDLTEYLRWRTYLLKEARADEARALARRRARRARRAEIFKKAEARRRARAIKKARSKGPAEVAAAQDPGLILKEVEGLPPERRLIESGDYLVFYTSKDESPHILSEIGRLREIVFREVGEGTGHAYDLDRFDDYYLHMCLWNRAAGELVGSYRLGPADRIIAEHGIGGLYTATLFQFDPEFFQKAHPALELGRSFIRTDYQRTFSALYLLWKGIGGFLVKHMKYRYIFGPVSVSNDYRPFSRRLMVDFIQTHEASPLSNLVVPRRPVHFPPSRRLDHMAHIKAMKDIDELSEIIADIEGPGVGVPILLKQYIKLAAQSVAWNLDPEFGNAMDCLMVSDLVEAESKTMNKYLGKDGLKEYRRRHLGDAA